MTSSSTTTTTVVVLFTLFCACATGSDDIDDIDFTDGVVSGFNPYSDKRGSSFVRIRKSQNDIPTDVYVRPDAVSEVGKNTLKDFKEDKRGDSGPSRKGKDNFVRFG